MEEKTVKHIALCTIAAAVIVVFVNLFVLIPDSGVLTNTYESPYNDYKVNVYLANGGATVDFAIRAEIEYTPHPKRSIYWQYHESETNVTWLDKNTVQIGSRTLNIYYGTYDWRFSNPGNA